MKTMTSTLAKLVSLTSLLTAMACSGADPESGTSQPLVGAGQGECAEDGESEEPNDKVFCSVDGDCDSDEFCLNGRCTGYDGDVEDETEDECDDDVGEEDEDGADDEEEEDDKIVCSVDADCDSDEVCTNGLCD